jgi:adenylate cyclase
MALHVTLVASVLYLQLRFAMGRRGKTRERLADAHRQLRQEQERSERLLLNILPAPIAARLKDNSVTIADGHPEVVVMFADIVDYTRIASGMNSARGLRDAQPDLLPLRRTLRAPRPRAHQDHR